MVKHRKATEKPEVCKHLERGHLLFFHPTLCCWLSWKAHPYSHDCTEKEIFSRVSESAEILSSLSEQFHS